MNKQQTNQSMDLERTKNEEVKIAHALLLICHKKSSQIASNFLLLPLSKHRWQWR